MKGVKRYVLPKVLSAGSCHIHIRNLQDATSSTPQCNLWDIYISLFYASQTDFPYGNYIFFEDPSPQITSPHYTLYIVSLMLFRNHSAVLLPFCSFWLKEIKLHGRGGSQCYGSFAIFFSKSVNLFQISKWVKTFSIYKNIFSFWLKEIASNNLKFKLHLEC